MCNWNTLIIWLLHEWLPFANVVREPWFLISAKLITITPPNPKYGAPPFLST